MADQTSSPRTRVTLGQHCGDFANVFKAFIGGNYLSVSFGLSQSGFMLGILGLIFIAILTDHCCHLIVKCKRCIVGKVVEDYMSVTGHSEYDDTVQEVRRNVENKLSYGDIGRFCYGKLGLFIVDLSLLITQFLFCVSYCIFIGNAIHTIVVRKDNGTSPSSAPVTTSSPGPPLEVLVLAALPVFIAFSFIHSVRKLSALSTVANVAIFGGFFSILVYMIVGFRPASNGIEWFAKWETFPVFFGQMTSAYEGIGLIIPIESSMDGNRQYFSPFLHASMLLLTCLFAVFGGLGYIRHGAATAQTINLNIYPQDGTLAIVVNITLIVGIIFTFPLQFYPVAEILESWIFGKGCPQDMRCCRRGRTHNTGVAESEDDDMTIVDSPSDFCPITLSAGASSRVAPWKRSVMRILVVLLAGALAVAFRQVFAYLIAFTGAIGCTMLAFILPCIFHIKLEKTRMSKWVLAKNICVIVISVFGGGASLYITIREIIHNLSSSALTL